MTSGGGAFTLGARDFKGVQCVATDNESAVCVGNGQMCNITMKPLANSLDTMHDQQAVLVPDIAHALHAKANCQYREDSETYILERGREDMTDTNTSEPIMMSDRKGHNGISEDGTATTLAAQEKERPVVGTSIVRRLVPVETERLQMFPDDWSRYGINEKGEVYELPDSARYKLQGNSIARPFWRWLTRRISAYYETPPTLGSLFDGQGGFPLCWEEVNGKGSAVWASEIEKHAIAVTKFHFPED